MVRNVEKLLSEWHMNGLIDNQTETAILEYERKKTQPKGSTTLTIFAILGAVLTGLGISLIVAENWDNIPQTTKTIIAFLPVVLGQMLVFLALFRYKNSEAWREASAALLLLTTGASQALLSQIFQLQGELNEFLLVWMVLVTPVMFLTKSRTALLLYLLLAIWFGGVGYYDPSVSHLHFWWFMFFVLVFIYREIYGKIEGRGFAIFISWMVPMAITVVFGNLFTTAKSWGFVGFVGLFQLFIILYYNPKLNSPVPMNHGLGFFGLIGSLFLLFLASFKYIIREIGTNINFNDLFKGTTAWITLTLIITFYFILAIPKIREKAGWHFFILPIFCLIILLSKYNQNLAQIIVNIFILSIALWFIIHGLSGKNLLWLNMGLIVFSLLVIMRFFDFNLSFYIRGLSFLVIGISFFIANRFILKAREGRGNE